MSIPDATAALRQCTVVASPSLESLVNHLIEVCPNVELIYQSAEQPSMETQQMDEVAAKAALDNLRSDLQRVLAGHHQSGALQLFLLDGKGLAGGNAASQATLRALAKSALNDPTNTVAALLPEEGQTEDDIPSALPDAVQSVMRQFLSNSQVTTLEGRDAVVSFLATL